MLSVAIVSHGHEEYFRELVVSLVVHFPRPIQVVVVDNVGDGAYFEDVLSDCGVSHKKVLRNSRPESFSRNYNRAVRQCDYESVLILNPDTKFVDGSLSKYLERCGGVVGEGLFFPSLLNFDGTAQVHGKKMPSVLRQLAAVARVVLRRPAVATPAGTDWFFAAAVLVQRKFFLEIGGFCEAFPMYCEDVEICDRVRRIGFPVERLREVEIAHRLGGDSKGKYLMRAIVSNILLRWFLARNWVFYRVLGGRVGAGTSTVRR